MRNSARETGREKQGENRDISTFDGVKLTTSTNAVRTVAAVGVHFLPWVLPLAVMARVVSPACSTTVPLVESLQSMDISYILGYTKDMDCSKGMFINWPMMKARWSKGIWREQKREQNEKRKNRTRTKRTTKGIRILDGVVK